MTNKGHLKKWVSENSGYKIAEGESLPYNMGRYGKKRFFSKINNSSPCEYNLMGPKASEST